MIIGAITAVKAGSRKKQASASVYLHRPFIGLTINDGSDERGRQPPGLWIVLLAAPRIMRLIFGAVRKDRPGLKSASRIKLESAAPAV